jgi:hypothetical protein
MSGVSRVAEAVRKERRPVRADNPFLAAEQMMSDAIVGALDTYRDVRDTITEGLFGLIYGRCGYGVVFEPHAYAKPGTEERAHPVEALPVEMFTRGGPVEAILRILAGAVINRGVFDRRSVKIFRSLVERSQFKDLTIEQVRETFKQQARLLRQDPDRAIETVAELLPTHEQRVKAIDAVRQILMLAPEDVKMDRPQAKKLAEVLQIDPQELVQAGRSAAHVSKLQSTQSRRGNHHDRDTEPQRHGRTAKGRLPESSGKVSKSGAHRHRGRLSM